MKPGDLVKYKDYPDSPVGLALKVYKHLQEFRDVKPFMRELVDVLWRDSPDFNTHDTYEIEVVSESR